MDNYNIFVRINYKTAEREEAICRTRVNNGNIKSSRYLIGGGVYNRRGGTVIFTAKNLEEVQSITKERPLLKDLSMNYNVAVIPKEI
ncbi:hypothetical protein N4T77_10880 [Clostridium sp. CX1]|uniref:YCII-related domain-containing protein n=1 Tax=Clostridium tanneri TaxID=3037988 RepID=A0ABU4JVW6_9CLOT|nr:MULTISPECIES: hypothetical protein [unclassified Clostridium]MCT8977108.1 hypothetical protein [Clostridium sp. CX1]MDW8802286.1 hypothetical protein [Clostridium sp. A1-XYC3]